MQKGEKRMYMNYVNYSGRCTVLSNRVTLRIGSNCGRFGKAERYRVKPKNPGGKEFILKPCGVVAGSGRGRGRE